MIFHGPKLLCCGTSPWLCTAAKILPARPRRQNIDRAEDPLYYCAFEVNFSSKIGLSVPLWIHRKKNAGKDVRSVMKEADWKKKKKSNIVQKYMLYKSVCRESTRCCHAPGSSWIPMPRRRKTKLKLRDSTSHHSEKHFLPSHPKCLYLQPSHQSESKGGCC